MLAIKRSNINKALEAVGLAVEGNKVGKAVKTPRIVTERVTVPIYNPAIHKAGDRVMVRRGGRLIETVIPELDAEGNAMPVNT